MHGILKIREHQTSGAYCGVRIDWSYFSPIENSINFTDGICLRSPATYQIIYGGESMPGNEYACVYFFRSCKNLSAIFDKFRASLNDVEEDVGIEKEVHGSS